MDPNVASFFTQDILPLFWKSAFLWAPIGLGVIAWLLWIRYVNHEYMESLEWDLLEVKIPRDVMRSPAAMEMVL
ncbi:MAG: hypothetical protein OEX08_03310, partial [Candidatus Nomurabacteria bacterium]|nr:hypothetical protein [Candidatus Nomurabacteria bacterium]